MGKLFRPRNDIASAAGLDAYLRMGANSSYAGISVTPASARGVAAVFACARNIAEDMGKLPFEVFQQNTERERVRATTSPYWRLLHDKPNSFQSSQQFREFMTDCAVMRGNGAAFKNIIGGQIRELLPIHPDRFVIEQLPDYELLFHVTMADGSVQTFTRKQIFHLPGLTVDGPVGVSVISFARQTIGTALGANRHAGTFFGNGMKPSGIFKHPSRLKDDAFKRLKDQLQAATSGNNSNETLVIEEGMEFQPVTLNARDSQFLESRTFEVVEICRWFRMPPHKISELSRATFSNIEHQDLEYTKDTLMPWGKRWEYAVNQQVISTNNVYAELNFDAQLRGATLERYQAYQLAAGGPAPWMRRNEVRRRENLEPIDGLDEMLVPLNMGAAGQQGGGNANDTTTG
jgi:HK97 family phage portal protein